MKGLEWNLISIRRTNWLSLGMLLTVQLVWMKTSTRHQMKMKTQFQVGIKFEYVLDAEILFRKVNLILIL